MPVKIDPIIPEELAAMNLVLWEAKHGKLATFNAETGKTTTRENKNWVMISLTGPGVAIERPAGAPTLREAVDLALRNYFSDRVPGLRGAMMRLEKACSDLALDLAVNRNFGDNDDDDEIPF